MAKKIFLLDLTKNIPKNNLKNSKAFKFNIFLKVMNLEKRIIY